MKNLKNALSILSKIRFRTVFIFLLIAGVYASLSSWILPMWIEAQYVKPVAFLIIMIPALIIVWRLINKDYFNKQKNIKLPSKKSKKRPR